MAKNLRDLANSLRAKAKDLDNLASDLAVEGTAAMLEEMVEVNPVDTTASMSNWQIGIGSRPNAVIEAHSPGDHGSSRQTSANKTIADGMEKLQSKQPGQSIWLSNPIDYIGDLDQGSSGQFAGGFIPRALIVFRLAIQEALKRRRLK